MEIPLAENDFGTLVHGHRKSGVLSRSSSHVQHTSDLILAITSIFSRYIHGERVIVKIQIERNE